MESVYLKKLTINDDRQVYDMLQRIAPHENEFVNSAYGLSFQEYQKWLIEQEAWSRGESLPKGFVAQSIYWLYEKKIPVGIGKIRHELTEQSRKKGGNIGYAIDPLYRGEGYATLLLSLLLLEANSLGIDNILLTVEKNNPASRRVIEKNGGKIIRENQYRWFFTI